MGKRKVRELEGVAIEKVADKGYGIGYRDGKVVFVERAVPGDVVDVRLYKNKAKFAMGYPTRFTGYSPDRVEPFCAHFGTCGGCHWQNLPYERQLAAKTQLVTDAMERIAKLQGVSVRPAIGADPTVAYRNKLEFTFANQRWLTPAELAAGAERDVDTLGYHVPRFFDKILHVDRCHLQPEPSNAIRDRLRDEAVRRGLSFYDHRTREGLLRNVIIRNNRRGEFLVILVASADTTEARALLDDLAAAVPEVVSTWLVANDKPNSSIADLEARHHGGLEALEETLGRVRYRVGPKSFFQTNPHQAETLAALAREGAGLRPEDTVYDLYTGLGSLALYVADACARVVGIEWIEEAVADARANAALNGIGNAAFHAGDMAKLLTGEFIEAHGRPDVLITDPPRAGMHDKVNRRIVESGARTVVYVSCNPATQARDLEQLGEAYAVESLQPVDMFPHTYHIENVAVLRRRD
jgi:23S rRNA (uracil1939-C5)-methyltransferase